MTGAHRSEPDRDPAVKTAWTVAAGIGVAGLVGWILAAIFMSQIGDQPAPKPAVTIYRSVDVPTFVPSPSPSPVVSTRVSPSPSPYPVLVPGPTTTLTVTQTVTETVTETVTVTVTVTPSPQPDNK